MLTTLLSHLSIQKCVPAEFQDSLQMNTELKELAALNSVNEITNSLEDS